jgi:hypothetical protein
VDESHGDLGRWIKVAQMWTSHQTHLILPELSLPAAVGYRIKLYVGSDRVNMGFGQH